MRFNLYRCNGIYYFEVLRSKRLTYTIYDYHGGFNIPSYADRLSHAQLMFACCYEHGQEIPESVVHDRLRTILVLLHQHKIELEAAAIRILEAVNVP